MEPGAPKRVIVVFPRIEVADRLEQLHFARSRFDPLASVVAPHLTLVFPFRDVLDDDALADHVTGAVSGQRPFPIVLAGVTAHEDQYLFLNVKRGNDELIALHDALYAGPLARHLSRRHTFVPHLTVGRVPRERLDAALDEMASLEAPLSAIVDALSIYRVDPDGTRPLLRQIPF